MRHAQYDNNLNEATRFEDFVCHELCLKGITFARFGSKEYQCLVGENSAGIEIKLDRRERMERPTGNVFVEIAERHNEYADWKNSGPFKGDTTWLVVIGDYEKFRVFGAKRLRWGFDRYVSGDGSGDERFKFVETATAKGFTISAALADDLCELLVNPITKPPKFPDSSAQMTRPAS